MRIIIFILLVLSACKPTPKQYDIIFTNGTIVDGLGNDAFVGDLAIKGDKIVKVSTEKINPDQADTVVDIRGKIVSPGFIDSHAHIQTTIHQYPQPENFLRQGITTICASLHSGDQPYPIDKYAVSLKVAPNVAFFSGLNWTRKKVMGLENRPATKEELDSMKYYVEQSMEQGALGFSVGQIYVPGLYSSTEEIIALAKVAAKYNGIYITHMRNEGSGLLSSIRETIRIAKEAKMPAQINHFKAAGVAQFGLASRGLEIIDSARNAGIDISLDVYPYTAANTYSYILFPAWALDGGTAELAKRLKDEKLRKRIEADMKEIIMKDETGEDLSRIQFNSIPADTTFNGKTLQDYVKAKGYKNNLAGGIQAIIDLELMGGFLAIYHEMDEQDVINILKYPYSMIETDGDLVNPQKSIFPHPRSYGSFPRVIARYVRELKVLKLEEAIRKMTSMPANQIKQYNRGRIREGAYADIVVFDLDRIQDKATYTDSKKYSEGIEQMLINGKFVLKDAKLTGNTPGVWILNERAAK
ncbi:MAG: D-aminoacylase [Flammeovirgaceae bacterium]|nr:D-aminoacylase [Flammeovirgaceae bacterium]